MLCWGTDAWRMHSQYSTNILLLNQQNWADFCFQGLDSCATKDTRSSWFWQMVCRVPGGMLLLFIYTHLIWSDDHFKNPSTEFQKHFFQSRSDSRVSVVRPFVRNTSLKASKITCHQASKSSIKIKRQNQASKSSVKIKHQNQASKSSVKIKHQNQTSKSSIKIMCQNQSSVIIKHQNHQNLK